MIKKQSWIFLVLRVAIGALFVYSGYQKLMEPIPNFIGAILSYEIVNAWIAGWMAVILPWVQLIAGTFFVLGLWARPSLYILWALNTVFCIAISSALLRGIPIHDCGCFGEAGSGFPIQATLALDAVIFLILFWMNLNKQAFGALSLDSRLKA